VTIRGMPKIILETLFMCCLMIVIIFLCLNDKVTPELCGTLGGFVYMGLRMASSAARIISAKGSFESVAPSVNRLYSEL